MVGRRARRDQATGHRHEQRRNRGHETFTDRQNRVGLSSGSQIQSVLEDADDQPRHDIDGRDQHRRQRVALGEADRAVHRAVEIGLFTHAFAPGPRLLLVDHPGVEVGVDRHLAPWHRVQGETRRDFRDTHRAVVDHDELNGDEHDEHDDADHEVAADHELAEGHDDVARRLHAVGAVHEDESRRRHVERQPDQRQQEQQRGEDTELDRLSDIDHRQQQHDGQSDGHRQQQVEQQRRQRHDHQQHDRDDRDRRDGLRALDVDAWRSGGRHLRAPAA